MLLIIREFLIGESLINVNDAVSVSYTHLTLPTKLEV